ncbi:MAG TPA: P-II family nitrogen regulator [Chthoniobacterales bacterium]
MKRITAIIRMNRMNQTRQALVEAGYPAFTVRKVLGRGLGQVDYRVLHGAEEGQAEAIAHLKDDGPMLVPKRMMTIVAPQQDVAKVVQTLLGANKTGNKGDGKIFIQPVAEAIRIRTGERGSDALNLN